MRKRRCPIAAGHALEQRRTALQRLGGAVELYERDDDVAVRGVDHGLPAVLHGELAFDEALAQRALEVVAHLAGPGLGAGERHRLAQRPFGMPLEQRPHRRAGFGDFVVGHRAGAHHRAERLELAELVAEGPESVRAYWASGRARGSRFMSSWRARSWLHCVRTTGGTDRSAASTANDSSQRRPSMRHALNVAMRATCVTISTARAGSRVRNHVRASRRL